MSQLSQDPIGGWQVHPEGSNGPELKGAAPSRGVLCQCFILLSHDLTTPRYVLTLGYRAVTCPVPTLLVSGKARTQTSQPSCRFRILWAEEQII